MTNGEENMSEYKVLRLMTKEIIICKIDSSAALSKNWWVILDPFEIKSFMNPQTGDYNSTLIDWLQFSSEDETKISLNDVLTCSVPEEEVLEHYIAIIKRKKGLAGYQENDANSLDELKQEKEPEVTFEDYMEILNTNKVYH